MANSTNAVIDVKVAGAQAASREMDRFGQSIKRASRAQSQLAGSANQANQSLRMIRGGAGQLGHQIQDIAVQLQGGTSAMIVFGQQGSQIASLFGPRGALIGAFLAVGAAVGTTLFNSFKSTEEMMRELEDSISDVSDVMNYDAKKSAYELSDEFIRLYRTTEDLAELQLKVKYVKALGAVSQAQDMLRGSTQRLISDTYQFTNQYNAGVAPTLDGLGRKFGATDEQYRRLTSAARGLKNGNEGAAASFISVANEIASSTGQMTEKYREFIAPIVEQAMAYADAEERAKFLKGALENLSETVRISSEDDTKKVNQLQRLVLQYEDQAAAINKTARAMALLRAERLNAGPEEIKRINAAFDEIEAEERRKKAYKETTKSLKVQAKAMKESDKIMRGLANGMADAIINAENMKDAFTNMARSIVNDLLTMYLRAQMYNMLGAVVNMFTASNQLAPQGQMMYAGAESGNFALGAPEFDGGGFTGFGARAGGLDGKGGFMAMLHPNETVIDHTKGQGMGGNVVVNLNISTGVAQTVRAEMMNLMPAITQATKSAVLDARMRGGSYSKGLVGA